MKFVHVEDFIHPDAGYQVNLLSKLQVQQGHEVFVVTSELKKIPSYLTSFFGKENIEVKDKRFFESTGVRIIRIPLIGFYSGRAIYSSMLFKVVDSLNPDVLFVHGEDTLMGIQFILRYSKQKYPMVMDCHMLEMASRNRFRNLFRFFYRKIITPKIIKNDIPVIRVVDSNYVEKCLGIPLSKTILLSFGTDTSYFRPDHDCRLKFRSENGIADDDFVIIYAGKLDVNKGGVFFAESIKERFSPESRRKVVFIVIGNTVDEYGEKIEMSFTESENRIIRFQTQAYYDLAKFYQAADLAVFPKQCSMSFFEVQSCGLPVVVEANEINIGRIKFGNGFSFKTDDKDDFRSKLLRCIDMDQNDYSAMKNNARKYIVNNFDYMPIAQKFTDVMIDEVMKRELLSKNEVSEA